MFYVMIIFFTNKAEAKRWSVSNEFKPGQQGKLVDYAQWIFVCASWNADSA